MLINIILFNILVLITVVVIEKNIYNPITILYSIWSVIFILCYINHYNYIYTTKSILLLFLGLFSALSGYIVTNKIYKKVNSAFQNI